MTDLVNPSTMRSIMNSSEILTLRILEDEERVLEYRKTEPVVKSIVLNYIKERRQEIQAGDLVPKR